MKRVRLFGDGYPINFFCTWRPGIPISVMDMIYAEMIYSIGIFFIISSKGIIRPDDEVRNIILL